MLPDRHANRSMTHDAKKHALQSPARGLRDRRGKIELVALVGIVALFASLAARPALAQKTTPLTDVLKEVGIDQKLGEQVPLDLEFVDELGQNVRLGDYFGKRPVVLTMVYFRCPMLCTQVLNGFLKTSAGVPQTIGRDYDVVTVSFDDREGPKLAAEKKASYVSKYHRAGADQGWHFLTGSKESIARLADAVGFRYKYEPRNDQFAHASGIMVLTPGGKVSRYFFGIEYPPRDMRLGLVESSEGKIGSPIERILLLCYQYDPMTGKYGLVISRGLKAAGLLTLGVLGVFMFFSFRKEMRMPRLTRGEAPAGGPVH